MKRQYVKLLHGMAVLLAACLLAVMPVLADASVSAGSTAYTVTNYAYLPGLQSVVPMAGNQFLVVDLILQTAADAGVIQNPQQHLLALDGSGRVYAPLLFNGDSDFTASLKPGERPLRVLFEVPETMASYDLLVLSGPEGGVSGIISLGKSLGPVVANSEAQLASFSADGFTAVIHSVTQSRTAFMDKAPEGMKYVFIDATVTAAGSSASVSQWVAQWAVLDGGGQRTACILPTRSVNMLALANATLGSGLPAVRGQVCFLVPENTAELSDLSFGETSLGQPLPLGDILDRPADLASSADGVYRQADWKVTIHGMRMEDKGTLSNPPAGNRYVIVSLTVANDSTQNLTISSELGFAMTDDKGNELVQAWFSDLSDTVDATLLPSESVSGDVAFLLPKGAKAGTLRVHLSMMGQPLVIDAGPYLSK